MPFQSVHSSPSVFFHSLWNTPSTSDPKRLLKSVTSSPLERSSQVTSPLLFQPMQKSERPICVSWSTDVGDGGWTPSGCEVLGASETHTYCSCKRLANLAVIMAFGELTVSADDWFSGSLNIWLQIQWENILGVVGGSLGDREMCAMPRSFGSSRSGWET